MTNGSESKSYSREKTAMPVVVEKIIAASINAVVWIARSGAPWRDLLERYGNWNSVFQRFNRWSKKGVWERVFQELQDPDFDWIMIDSTMVRAHQHAAGQKKDGRIR